MADKASYRDDEGRTSRDKASNVTKLATARHRASEAARVAGQEIDSNPFALVAGGMALGVLIGSALPRSTRETELLRPIGQRLVETARAATEAARETGREELAAAGLSRINAKGQANRLFDNVVHAFVAAAQAGAKSAQRSATEGPASL